MKRILSIVMVLFTVSVSAATNTRPQILQWSPDKDFAVLKYNGALWGMFDRDLSMRILAGLYEKQYYTDKVNQINRQLGEEIRSKKIWRAVGIAGGGAFVVSLIVYAIAGRK